MGSIEGNGRGGEGFLMAFRLFQDLLVLWIAHDVWAGEDACTVFPGRNRERRPFVGD